MHNNLFQQFLYQKLDNASQMGFLNQQIPSEIKNNLNPNFKLRRYQEEAFKRFIFYFNQYPEKIFPIHLLFNMATGSGKTLIMAGLILYLYQKGYRNFLFFVNSNNIIEKTKDNFLGQKSFKYLFNQKITFNNSLVFINQVQNFEAVNQDNINICFTTIQKLHSDLYNEKENAITFEDFKKHKIVLISDEAHHLQAKTKQTSLSKALEKPTWENTVKRIFEENQDNLLLEFTATLLDDASKQVIEKYCDKIIYRYDLKEFRNDGFSKDINILQSDLDENARILQAILLNQYRQEVAGKNKISLKPVILFKSQKTIEESKQNQLKFEKLISELTTKKLENLKKNTKEPLIQKVFQFFQDNKITNTILIKKLQKNFALDKCLNVNEANLDRKSLKKTDQQELVHQQYVLNSLEDKNNQIRAIFAVQKLNEGWDVLNLFDIVRLYQTRDAKAGKPGKTTIAEAQLIGRGARYFPFIIENQDDKYKRKFDKDLKADLRILEELHYHSVKDSRYIAEIRQALKDKGLIDEKEIKKDLLLKEEFKKKTFYKEGLIYLNKRIKTSFNHIKSFEDLGVKKQNINYAIQTGETKNETILDEENFKLESQVVKSQRDLKLNAIENHIIKSALSKINFYKFNNLKVYFKKIKSINNFINHYLGKLEITFEGNQKNLQNLTNQNKLNAVLKLLATIKKDIQDHVTEFQGSSEFEPKKLNKIFYKKTLKIKRGDERENGQEELVKDKDWYVFNANYGTEEEKKFVELIDRKIKELSQQYQEIYLIRNELHFKIYNFKDGQAFAPDFVLFLNNEQNQKITYQIFIEAKGGHLMEHDRWKEDFLKEIKVKFKDKILLFNETKKYRILGVPFYNEQNENKFKESLLDCV